MYFFRSLLCCAMAMYAAGVVSASAQPAGENEFAQTITSTALDNRLRLEFDGQAFSGPAWDRLLEEAKAAQFLLIGEEHGIAENPMLAGQLFAALSDDGYERVVIETSPHMAKVLDRTIFNDGLDGLRSLFAQRGGEPAFFGMKEEAEFLAAVRDTSKKKTPILWGVDYEVASDPMLLQRLKEKRKPRAAASALDALAAASDAGWAKYYETSGPQHIFSFSGDPALVRAVEDAWPGRDEEAAWILDTIEETLEINRLWVAGEGWRSNARRAAFMRSNFITHWNEVSGRSDPPKVMAKLGSSHLVRGRNMTETYDLGSLLPELAAINGEKSFSFVVLPGAEAMTAVLDPTVWSYKAAPGKDNYGRGLEAVTSASFDDAFTLIDLRALRPLMRTRASEEYPALARIIHGFDMMLIMTGGSPSGEFDHEAPSRTGGE